MRAPYTPGFKLIRKNMQSTGEREGEPYTQHQRGGLAPPRRARAASNPRREEKFVRARARAHVRYTLAEERRS